jgi:hypothetical protein
MRSPTIAERISYDPRDSKSKNQFLHKENPQCSVGYDCALIRAYCGIGFALCSIRN